MHVRLDIAVSVIQHNQDKAKSSLENAKKDGHISSQSKNTRRNVTVLAEICQELSQKWLHTRFQVIILCIPGEHVYA
jgi:hypothetical protein